MRAAVVSGVIAGLLATAPAAAAPSAWARLPDQKQMSAAYPAALSALRISGRASLACKVGADRTLRDCQVAAEQPAGLGFGLAAMGLALLFVVKTAPAGGEITVPIRFEPAPDELLARGEGYRPPKSTPEQQALARQVAAHAVPGDWMAARIIAFVAQDLPASAGMGEDAGLLAAAKAAVQDAAKDDLPWMMETTALELAARMSPAKLQAALAAPPPADPGDFLNASFKGAPPKWALAMALKVQGDARARFCAGRGC